MIRVICAEPVGGFKGPMKVYMLRVGDREVKQTDECDFKIGDLSYLTSYTVEVCVQPCSDSQDNFHLLSYS